MNLDLDETQILLRDTVREYLENEVPFDRARESEKSGKADAKLWAELCAHGWLATPLPADFGGGDGTLVEAGLIVEEIERRAAIVPTVEVLMSILTVQRFSEADTARKLAAEVLAGTAVLVPAVLEGDDHFDSVTASVDSEGRLTGTKDFVDYAEFATHHLVAAKSAAGEVGLYLVESGAAGTSLEALHHIGRTPQSTVSYAGVPATPICGADGHAFLVNLGRAFCSVQAVSCMQKALDESVIYTSVREQFSRPIGTFQAAQHHAANMAILVESARFLAYEALDSLERGTATAEQVAIAKAAASKAVPEVTMLAQQLHGGHGYIEENDLYFFTLRGKEHSLKWGTGEECLNVGAATVDRPEDWL